MEPIKLITEKEIKSFLKAGTTEDIEIYFNSLILIKKHIDIDKKILDKNYGVRLVDKKIGNGCYYEVASNAIGLEALRVISRKHNIENGGSETKDSLFISLYEI